MNKDDEFVKLTEYIKEAIRNFRKEILHVHNIKMVKTGRYVRQTEVKTIE